MRAGVACCGNVKRDLSARLGLGSVFNDKRAGFKRVVGVTHQAVTVCGHINAYLARIVVISGLAKRVIVIRRSADCDRCIARAVPRTKRLGYAVDGKLDLFVVRAGVKTVCDLDLGANNDLAAYLNGLIDGDRIAGKGYE